jgi:saccharopine dehydrogenase (NAD+, L-glutamate forming)
VDRLSAAATMVSAVAAVFLLAQIPPARQILLRRIGSGTGPNAAARESRWFNIRFTGEGGGERVVTELSGGDPGYGESSKMVAESALCLAFDELAPRAGQLTPALAMGDALIARLRRSGISFDVLQSMKISAAEGSDKVAPIV